MTTPFVPSFNIFRQVGFIGLMSYPLFSWWPLYGMEFNSLLLRGYKDNLPRKEKLGHSYHVHYSVM
jgi:hypothetical protein